MHPSCWLKWTLALGLVLLVAGTGAPTASADTTLFYYDDVSTGGGGGAALAPVGYWTCHHKRYVTFYRYNTTIELPYGNLWDTYPSWCTAYVDRLVCSSVISFYVPAQGGPS